MHISFFLLSNKEKCKNVENDEQFFYKVLGEIIARKFKCFAGNNVISFVTYEENIFSGNAGVKRHKILPVLNIVHTNSGRHKL